MSARPQERRLGRGLAALLGDVSVARSGPAPGGVRLLALDQLEVNPFQPRSRIDPDALAELADSIRAYGVVQPLLARPHPRQEERFHIVAGERRWRAAALAGLAEVPVLVQALSDADAAAVALVENLQREDLNAIEEAEGYNRLLTEFAMTQETLASAVGKSRTHVTNVLRLLNLPGRVQQEVRDGRLSFGHARALAGHPDPEALLPAVLEKGLNVRQTEALAARPAPRPPPPRRPAPAADADTRSLERQLSEALGYRVSVALEPGGGGSLRIRFEDLDQLGQLAARLSR
jgi:ParB family chromosome partitioning protein